MSRKKHPQSRWCGGRARYSTERMTMDARWVKDGRGQWRHEVDQISETGFTLRRKEREHWHQGARIVRAR